MTKAIYKQLLTVWRNPRTGKPEVASAIYEVRELRTEGEDASGDASGSGDKGGDGDGGARFFKDESLQNWFYIATDPFRRTCKVWVHKFEHHW